MKFLTVPSGISKEQIDDLKNEIKKAQKDPDYLIITNYEIYMQELQIDENTSIKS